MKQWYALHVFLYSYVDLSVNIFRQYKGRGFIFSTHFEIAAKKATEADFLSESVSTLSS